MLGRKSLDECIQVVSGLLHETKEVSIDCLQVSGCIKVLIRATSDRTILVYLVAARLIRGRIPTDELLIKYELLNTFNPLILALKAGNFRQYMKELDSQKQLWLQKRLYYILSEHTKTLFWRRLLKILYVFRSTCCRPESTF